MVMDDVNIKVVDGFNLNEFCKKSFIVAKARQDNGGKIDVDPGKMLKHCATEVVEAMEAYYPYKVCAEYTSNGTCYDGLDEPDVAEQSYRESKEDFESELADIVSCCAIIAGNLGIDLEDALVKCYQRNKLRSENKGDKK